MEQIHGSDKHKLSWNRSGAVSILQHQSRPSLVLGFRRVRELPTHRLRPNVYADSQTRVEFPVSAVRSSWLALHADPVWSRCEGLLELLEVHRMTEQT